MNKALEFFIHFDDCDPAGIVFFANYFKLAHRAIEEFLPQIGIEWDDWFNNSEYGVPLVNASSDFKQPMFQGKKYLALVTPIRIGESSVSFQCEFKTQNGELCASVSTTHVFIDTKARKKTPIPQQIKIKLMEATA